jgi:hypothetical protein
MLPFFQCVKKYNEKCIGKLSKIADYCKFLFGVAPIMVMSQAVVKKWDTNWASVQAYDLPMPLQKKP